MIKAELERILDVATCYHEAAHAVFAVKVCGGEVIYVSADEGNCRSAMLPAFGGYSDYWRLAMQVFSGLTAESKAIDRELRPDSWEELSWRIDEAEEEGFENTDYHMLAEHVKGMASDPYEAHDPEEHYRVVAEDTKSEVRRLWAEITAVAEALKKRRCLDGDEVSRLIESARKGEK